MRTSNENLYKQIESLNTHLTDLRLTRVALRVCRPNTDKRVEVAFIRTLLKLIGEGKVILTDDSNNASKRTLVFRTLWSVNNAVYLYLKLKHSPSLTRFISVMYKPSPSEIEKVAQVKTICDVLTLGPSLAIEVSLSVQT